MTADDYQDEVRRTMEGGEPRGDLRLCFFGLGVAGEGGEVADLIKKWVGHKKPRDVDALKKELGDVLWYVAALAADVDLRLSDVMQANVEKLRARYPEGFSYDKANAPR